MKTVILVVLLILSSHVPIVYSASSTSKEQKRSTTISAHDRSMIHNAVVQYVSKISKTESDYIISKKIRKNTTNCFYTYRSNSEKGFKTSCTYNLSIKYKDEWAYATIVDQSPIQLKYKKMLSNNLLYGEEGDISFLLKKNYNNTWNCITLFAGSSPCRGFTQKEMDEIGISINVLKSFELCKLDENSDCCAE